MTDHFKTIYATQADNYHRMISREDYEGRLMAVLREIHPLSGARVVDFGTGTGRLVRLLAPHVSAIYGFDIAHHMLMTASHELPQTGHWALAVGDNAQMPVASHTADLVTAGWSFGHATGWYPEAWQTHISAAIGEMQRIAQPGGTLVIMETLGTGNTHPAPPTPLLAAFYAWLEGELGFSHTWTRTDYRFDSVDEADTLTRFFFGDDLADRIRREGLTVLPECTGIWWRQV